MARLVVFLVSCLLAQALCVPAGSRRPGNRRRPLRADNGFDDDVNGNDSQTTSTTSSYDIDDDDDDFDDTMQAAPSTGGGSNIMSLLNLATALFPSASGATLESMIRRVIRDYFIRNPVMLRRQDIADNVIEIDYVNKLIPPFLRQEDENGHDTNESDDSNGHDSNDSNDDDSDSEENDNAAEESIEENNTENDKASKQDSGLNDDDNGNDDGDNDSDYSDEPPGGGDGQGGGVLGLLAGLSGGEDGSDLGSLLAAVSGIVGSLSGDGFDLNALIATGFGLFVGLLSEGEENPGSIIASYLLTSLDTITGGGSKNNGAFIGNFLSKLIKGTSAVSDESGSSEENGDGNKMKMSDSTGFFGSSDGASDQLQSPLWTLKMDILRSVLQFGASILGMASASFTRAVTV